MTSIPDPLFNAPAFAVRLREAVREAGGVREASRRSGVSPATITRACHVWPALSHEAWLRLNAWMAGMATNACHATSEAA